MNDHIEKISDLKKLLSKKIFQKILLISGKKSFYKTGADKIFLDLLKEKNFHLYLKKSYLPEFEELKNIITIKQKIKPDLIIAVGGGCVMDLSKISSVFHETRNLKEKAINSDFSKKIKVLAIPTTAGSGAEVTSNAVIYIKNIKYSVEGELIKPDYFFLIPKLLKSSNLILDATTCFDAVSQSIESMFSKKSNNESLFHAEKSLKILLKNSFNYINSKNLKNSHKMLVGANLAGRAINISKTIAPHALSYPFTTLYGIPHGHAVSLTFNNILKYNYLQQHKSDCDFNVDSRYQILFKITKTKNIYELDKFFENFKKKLHLEQNFKKLKIDLPRDKNKILSSVNDQRLKNNPVKITKRDILNIFEKFL